MNVPSFLRSFPRRPGARPPPLSLAAARAKARLPLLRRQSAAGTPPSFPRSLGRRSSVVGPLFRLGVGIVACSGLILYGPLRPSMGAGAVTLMLLHLVLGLVLGVGALSACLFHLRRAGPSLTGALAVCLGTGVLIVASAAGGEPLRGHERVLVLHLLAGLAACGLGLWARERGSEGARERGNDRRSLSHSFTLSLVHSRCLLLPAMVLPVFALAAYRYDPEGYYRGVTATNSSQAESVHFPAGLAQEGKRPWVPRAAAYCGEVGCHEREYREWRASAHAAAGEDPFYRASLQHYAARDGADAARWCRGCHEPTGLLLVTRSPNSSPKRYGRRNRTGPGSQPPQPPNNGGSESALIPRSPHYWGAGGAPPNSPTASRRGGGRGERLSHSTASSAADMLSLERRSRGVDCLTCHAMTRVRDLAGNGRFVLATPGEYPFAERREPALRWLHGFLMRLRPGPHRRAMLEPELHRRSEACAPCHRTSYTVAQNRYKFLRGADEYGAWQESPFSDQSIPSPGTAAKSCSDCHMPIDSGRRTHTFLASNTALPALRGDLTHLGATHRFLQNRAVTVDLFALRRVPPSAALPGGGHRADPYEPLEETSTPLRPGAEVAVEILVTNRDVGHDFPGGSGDLQEVWIETALRDTGGRALLGSGLLRRDGTVDPEAHAYRLTALDRAGRAIERNNLYDMITAVAPFVPRVIPAGQSELVRYRFRVPQRPGRLRMTVRLLHRRVNPEYARWALTHLAPAGNQPPQPPNNGGSPARRASSSPHYWGAGYLREAEVLAASNRLPITVLAEDHATFVVAPAPLALTREPAPRVARATEAMRQLAYGNALMRQQDLARAARAMRRVSELLPGKPHGAIGLARVYLEEGDLLAARAHLETALRMAPDEQSARSLLGRTYREMGQYQRALAVLEPLAKAFPRDRHLQFQVGRCYFQSGRYEDAAAAFTRMLDVDPNDLSGHYNLMVCNRYLRRFPEMRREEAIYRYLKEDESVRRLTARYLAAHPAVDREAQSIHEHVLRPVPATRANEEPQMNADERG